MLDPSIAFALLAAGSSKRFGGDKLTADLAGKPVWRRAADAAEAAGFATRFLIVSGAASEALHTSTMGWTVAINREADSGISSSIRLAAALAANCSRLVIGLADMPCVGAAHLRQLAQADGIAFTRYPHGNDGVPAAFPRAALGRLQCVTGDSGAAALRWEGDRRSFEPASPIELLDLDTPEDLARAEAAFKD